MSHACDDGDDRAVTDPRRRSAGEPRITSWPPPAWPTSAPASSSTATPSPSSTTTATSSPAAWARKACTTRGRATSPACSWSWKGSRPFFLGSTVRDENDQLAVALTNPDLLRDGEVRLPLGTLHLAVKKFLWRGRLLRAAADQEPRAGAGGASLALHFAGRLRGHLRGPRHEAEGPGPGSAAGGRRRPGRPRLPRAGRRVRRTRAAVRAAAGSTDRVHGAARPGAWSAAGGHVLA